MVYEENKERTKEKEVKRDNFEILKKYCVKEVCMV